MNAADSSIPKHHLLISIENRGGIMIVKLQRNKQQKAWGLFRRYPNNTNYMAYKTERAEARRVRCRSQRGSWINYVSNINYNRTWK